MSEERRLVVLRAIVQDYVSTSEPVASKALLDRHALGVSAATIRNDMAALEEAGLITAPHTSAGRIPTDAGYRLFVDRLSEVRPLSAAQRAAIGQFLEGAVDLDDVVDRTVRLLASITRQVAMVQYPSLTRSRVQHIELVPIATGRLMVVLILTTGRVEQRIVPIEADLLGEDGEALLADLRARFNEQARDKPLVDVARTLTELPDDLPHEHRDLVRAIVRALEDALVEEREERVVLAGTSNLARVGADFPLSIGPVLSALEEHVVLLRLFGSLAEDVPRADIAVTIGHENPHADLAETSVVSAGYGAGGDVVGGLGVLGPTRMDYPRTMASVRAVARYVSEMLAP
ncbi:MAG: heat-inducible transcriptional repressor HrcA [Mobilicoccus sp.]|nr:heat-inducible transcriptional repressor HrcA [Mobilicoccus sp.]